MWNEIIDDDDSDHFGFVTFLVECQVVGSCEQAAAAIALERLSTGVLPEVTGELVGPGETPEASVEHAPERFLPCKHGNKKFVKYGVMVRNLFQLTNRM